jgi:hypothetical protein
MFEFFQNLGTTSSTTTSTTNTSVTKPSLVINDVIKKNDKISYNDVTKPSLVINNVIKKNVKISYNDTPTLPKSTICNDFKNKLNTIKDIKEFVKKYDDEIIFDTLRMYKMCFYDDMIHHIENYPIDMIFICVKYLVSPDKIKTYNIDINYIQNDKTCLFGLDIKYLIKLLSSDLNFNVNYLDAHNKTFFNTILTLKTEPNLYNQLIDILIVKNYNFNILSLAGISLLDTLVLYHFPYEVISLFIKNQQVNLTLSLIWLFSVIKEYDSRNILNLVQSILYRNDSNVFLNSIMKNSQLYATFDNDMLLIMNIILHRCKDKLISMIEYVNDDGENILHIASRHHLDKVIRFIMTDKESARCLLIKNNQNKTPYDLYQENNIVNLLYNEIKLF